VKRYAVPAVLVALALVLAFLVFRDPSVESDGERALRKDHVFPAWRRDRITYVSLATAQGSLRLDRDPVKNVWSIHGSPDDADQARADVLLAELEQAIVVRKVEPSEGLGHKAARVRGEIGMGELVYRFSLGRDAPKPEGAAYVEVTGGGSYVVEKRLASALAAPFTDYRDKRLLPGKDPPSSVTVEAAERPSFTIVRDGKVRHRVGEGGPFASRAAVSELLSALAELRAVRFLSDREGGAALPSAPTTFRVVTEQGTHTFVKGGACPGAPEDAVVGRTSAPPVFACVPRGVLDTATRGRDAYTDKAAFFARVDEVEEVALTRPGHDKLDLARKGSGFRLRAPGEGRDLDVDASDGVRAWLASLLGLAGEPSEARGEPFSTVALVYGGVREEVRFVRTRDARIVAVRADGQGVVLPDVAARLVSPPAALLRGPRLVEASRRARELRLSCGGLSQILVRRAGLELAAPAPFALDVPLANQAFAAVVGARADAWVSDTRAGFVPARPPCTATLVLEDDGGPSQITLELSDPADAVVYGAVAGKDEVFVAPPALVAALSRPLVSREVFLVDADATLDLTVFRGLGVTKIGLDAADGGASLRDTLASLRPAFVVRRGDLQKAELDPSSPRLVVSVRGDGGPAKEATFRFGKEVAAPEGKVVYAVRDGVPFVFALSPEPVNKLLALVQKAP